MKTFLSLMTVLFLSFGAIAHAAETPAAKPAEKTAAKPAGKAPEIKVETFRDWRMECPADNKKSANCVIFQQLVAEKDGKQGFVFLASVLVAPIDKDGKKAPILRLATPTGVFLPPGIGMMVDKEEKEMRAPFLFCGPQRCFAEKVIDDALMKKLSAGSALKAGFRPAVGEMKPIMLDVSLKGFGEAFAALQKKAPLK